jgi:hypothetical protein
MIACLVQACTEQQDQEVRTWQANSPNLSQAEQALAKATSIDELKALRVTGKTLEAYAKAQKLGGAQERKASRFTVDVERKIGGILIADPDIARGGNTPTASLSTKPHRRTLAEYGFKDYQSWQYQRLAHLTDEEYAEDHRVRHTPHPEQVIGRHASAGNLDSCHTRRPSVGDAYAGDGRRDPRPR